MDTHCPRPILTIWGFEGRRRRRRRRGQSLSPESFWVF